MTTEAKLLEKAVQCLMNLTHLGLIDFNNPYGESEHQNAEDVIVQWRDNNPDQRFNQPWY